MTPDKLEAVERIVRELNKRKANNKIDGFFATEENRKQYPVHMDFFAAGAKYRQRLMMAANRVGKCITIDSVVETPDGKRSVRDLLAAAMPFKVIAWDEEKKERVIADATAPFKKDGLHDCYRITLADGQWIECADHHRFLCGDGWRRLSEFLHLLPTSRPQTSSGFVPKAHGAGVLHWLQRPLNYLSGCFQDYHLCGVQLRFSASTGLVYFPSQAGVPQHTFVSSRSGGRANRYTDSDQDACVLPSTLGEVRRFSGRFVESLSRTVCTIGQLLTGFYQAQPQPESESIYRPRSFVERGQCRGDIRHDDFLAFGSPVVLDANSIISCYFIGSHEVYDFTVDKYHCYVAASMVSHNTESGLCYETTLHATGEYPDWWVGRRFNKPVHAWLGGDTTTTVRDILQAKLLGPMGSFGTGLIKRDLIKDTTNKRGVTDAVEIIKVAHVSGSTSVIALKSYDQGREAWQGTEQDVVGFDEEPPASVYSEGLIRTMTTDGIVLSTFTPMKGLTEVTQSFLDIDKDDAKFVCTATWDDVGHLSEKTKKELWDSIPPHERDARAKGIPTIGVGKIYPVDFETLIIAPFDIPKHWVKGYSLDVGWNRTAAVWGALDRDSDTLYLYSEHYMGQAEPAVHASAIKGRGKMTGFIDPASRGRSQHDGSQLLQLYRNEGLTLQLADNAVEAGIFDVYQRMTSGRLFIFSTLQNLQKELGTYHRDDHGKIVKKNDHLCDCMRYLVRANNSMSYVTEGNFATNSQGARYLTSMPNRTR